MMTWAVAGSGSGTPPTVEEDREGSVQHMAGTSPSPTNHMAAMLPMPRKRSESFPDEQVLQVEKKTPPPPLRCGRSAPMIDAAHLSLCRPSTSHVTRHTSRLVLTSAPGRAQDGLDHLGIGVADMVLARGGERPKDAAWAQKEVQRDKLVLVRNSGGAGGPLEQRTRYGQTLHSLTCQSTRHP
jgi:hypothetical protein